MKGTVKGTALRRVSVVTIAIAVGLALYAIQLGNRLGEKSTPVVEQPDLPQVVVASKSISPGRSIEVESLSLESVSLVPEGAFHSLADVVGKTSGMSLVTGEPILEKHFRRDSAITSRLEVGERAIAVKVDGVIGLGGFIEPGDRVDVYVYMSRDQKEVSDTHARVLLEDVRVVAFGEKVDGQDSGDDGPTKARTAVLAVPQKLVSRLMLGSSKGRLRLALRSPSEEGGVAKHEDEFSVRTLAGRFAGNDDAKVEPPAKAAPFIVYRTDPKGTARY